VGRELPGWDVRGRLSIAGGGFERCNN